MNDSSPIFDDEDDVTQEIEANAERTVDMHKHNSLISTLEQAIRPLTEVLSREPLDAEQRDEQRHENDEEQSSS